MIPCSCAASSASAICFAIGSASSIGIAPWLSRWERSSPWTSSIAVELRITRTIDLSHAAGAESTNDFVHAETGTGCEDQTSRQGLYGQMAARTGGLSG